MMIPYHSIGIIHSPYKEIRGTPIQPAGALDVPGTVEVAPSYQDGLGDLEGFSHVILLYHFHLIQGHALRVTPFLDDRPHGIFATRSPKRPNAIGLSVVRLTAIAGAVLQILDIDVVDGTPLLDIKPYVPAFDHREATRTGWLAARSAAVHQTRADGRFL
jgi:tRNA-Thr(GGU) m(6)t(6)A37 methyltransferase TsaA